MNKEREKIVEERTGDGAVEKEEERRYVRGWKWVVVAVLTLVIINPASPNGPQGAAEFAGALIFGGAGAYLLVYGATWVVRET